MEEDAYGLKWGSEGGRNTERTPWEEQDGSFPVDLFRSWMQAMTQPGDFFRSLDPTISFVRPLIFYVVLFVLGSAASTVSWLAFPEDAALKPYIWLVFFLSPFSALLTLFLNIGVIHLGVRVFVPDARPVGVTARTLTYCMAPAVLVIIPWVGWIVSGLWSLALMVVGIQATHQTSFGRAGAAVIVPTIVFTITLTILAVLFGVILALAIGGAV